MTAPAPELRARLAAGRKWLRHILLRRAGRSGRLRGPAGTGRLIWIRSNGSRDSVLLGVELTRAVREHRQDVRIALTFQEDHEDLLRDRLRGLERVGLGYGPADTASAVSRVLRRLNPVGVVIAGGSPPIRLLRSLDRLQCPAMLVNVLTAAGSATTKSVTHQTDLLPLVTPAQVDTTLRSALCPDGLLWWLQTEDPLWARDCVAAWATSRLARLGVLLVGSGRPRVGVAGLSRLSQWDRTPRPAGETYAVDELRWLPAVAASASGVALDEPERFVRWQVLAGGAPACLRGAVDSMFSTVNTPLELVRHWEQEHDDPGLRRRRGDAGRRLFWAERRRATDEVAGLLDKIYQW